MRQSNHPFPPPCISLISSLSCGTWPSCFHENIQPQQFGHRPLFRAAILPLRWTTITRTGIHTKRPCSEQHVFSADDQLHFVASPIRIVLSSNEIAAAAPDVKPLPD
nr:hypothetical protein CFP56_56576 [Quercus suber]